MATTLFYNVSPENANSFKTGQMKDQKVIGFVSPDPQDADDFGYLLAGGKQYGASKAQIAAMISTTAGKVNVSATSTSFKDKDGNEISLTVDANGALTLSKYTAAGWSSLSITAPTKSENSATVEYGSSYSISASVSLSNAATVSYAISAGTETISNRSITVSYYDGVLATETPSKNSGSFTVDCSIMSVSGSKSGYATAATSVSVSSHAVSVSGSFTGSKVGNSTKTASADATTASASLTVQHRWVQHTSAISVTTAGTPTTANGATFISGTVTNGTVKYVNVGSKPSSFTATNGSKCYLAFKNSWGTPSFTDPSNFANTSWKKVSSLSIYGDDDYDVWVFVDVNQNPVAMNAAGAGTWKVAFK